MKQEIIVAPGKECVLIVFQKPMEEEVAAVADVEGEEEA